MNTIYYIVLSLNRVLIAILIYGIFKYKSLKIKFSKYFKYYIISSFNNKNLFKLILLVYYLWGRAYSVKYRVQPGPLPRGANFWGRQIM